MSSLDRCRLCGRVLEPDESGTCAACDAERAEDAAHIRAGALTGADRGRSVSYRWEDREIRLRVGSLARVEADGREWVELAKGHLVDPGMWIHFDADDRVVEPGVHDDMAEDVYHADPVPWRSLSSSMAKLLVQPGGPAKLRERMRSPREPKPEFDEGHAVHGLVLGAGAPLRLIPHDEWRTKEAKAAVAEARAEGAIPLKPAQWVKVHAMAEQLTKHRLASELLAHGVPEVSAFTTEGNVWLRARFDWVRPDCLVDLKTAAAADPGGFSTATAKWGYHLQAAHYLRVAYALGVVPEGSPFIFIAQEKTPPYLVSVIELSPAYLGMGWAESDRAIELWRTCLAEDSWPGYADSTVTIDPPAWLRAQHADVLDPAIEAVFAELLGET